MNSASNLSSVNNLFGTSSSIIQTYPVRLRRTEEPSSSVIIGIQWQKRNSSVGKA